MTRRYFLGATFAALLWATAACTTTLTSPTETETVTDVEGTFTSQLVPGGSATRAFTVASRGTVSVTLSTTTPAGTVVGLGIGIPQANGAGCTLNTSVETAAGSSPQLMVTADSGTYCAKVYDVGFLTTSAVPFTLLISRP